MLDRDACAIAEKATTLGNPVNLVLGEDRAAISGLAGIEQDRIGWMRVPLVSDGLVSIKDMQFTGMIAGIGSVDVG